MIVEEGRYPSIESVRKLIRQVFEVRGKLSEIGCQTDVDIENGRGENDTMVSAVELTGLKEDRMLRQRILIESY
jgi:hypothetical protein